MADTDNRSRKTFSARHIYAKFACANCVLSFFFCIYFFKLVIRFQELTQAFPWHLFQANNSEMNDFFLCFHNFYFSLLYLFKIVCTRCLFQFVLNLLLFYCSFCVFRRFFQSLAYAYRVVSTRYL